MIASHLCIELKTRKSSVCLLQWNVDSVPCFLRLRGRGGDGILAGVLSETQISSSIANGLYSPSPEVDAFFGLGMELCTEELRSFYERNPHVTSRT